VASSDVAAGDVLDQLSALGWVFVCSPGQCPERRDMGQGRNKIIFSEKTSWIDKIAKLQVPQMPIIPPNKSVFRVQDAPFFGHEDYE
jgi:hypothetical protein